MSRGNNVNFNKLVKYKINTALQGGRARFRHFPGATSKDLFLLAEP